MSYQVTSALQKGSPPMLASTRERSCHSTCCPAPSAASPRPCHPELVLSRTGQATKLDLSPFGPSTRASNVQ